MEEAEKPKEAPVLHAALSAHLQAIAQRELSPRMLLELEKTCSYARNILALGQDPAAVNRPPQIGMGNTFSAYQSSYGESPSDYGMPALSVPAETFGAQAIRQLMEIIPPLLANQQNKPEKVASPRLTLNLEDATKAIMLAKLNGDMDLERALRDALNKDLSSIAPAAASAAPSLPLPPALEVEAEAAE